MTRSPAAKNRRWKRYRAHLAKQPKVVDAAERRVVRLIDGRTGRLLSVPAQSSHVSNGAKARVLLPSGAVVSVRLDQVTVVFA